MNEIWKDIEGYEGLYEVSNLGRVKSIGYGKERILSPKIDKKGYLQVDLHKEGKGKSFRVHRLVAQAFLPNPEGLRVINHRDEDKTNNVVFLKDDGSVDESNLEWCNQKYNCNYGTSQERRVQTRINNGTYDPELCGIGGKEEHSRLYYQKNREKIRERQREYYRRRKKITA